MSIRDEPLATISAAIPAATPRGRAVKIASASGIAWSITRPLADRWGCESSIGWFSRFRPCRPTRRTLGWLSSSRASSPPAYPAAPTIPTEMVGEVPRARAASGPKPSSDWIALMIAGVYVSVNSHARRHLGADSDVACGDHDHPYDHEPAEQPAPQ